MARTDRKLELWRRRHNRVRSKVHGTAERPRLAVFRSNKHITAQLIDDDSGRTLASASTVEATSGGRRAATSTPPARSVSLVAYRAKAAGITTVVFDRGGFALSRAGGRSGRRRPRRRTGVLEA